MATPAGSEHRDLEERFRRIEQTLSDVVSATLRRQPVDSVNAQTDLVVDLPSTFIEITAARTTITVPDGYTRARVLMFVNAGATITAAGGGAIGVQPRVVSAQGPAVSNGTSGPAPVSVASFMSRDLANLDQVGGSFDLKLYAYVLGTVTAGSGNVHLSASVTFLR